MDELSVRSLKRLQLSSNSVALALLYGYMILSVFEGYISSAVGAISRYYIFAVIFILLFQRKNLSIVWSQVGIILWYILYLASSLWAPASAAQQMNLYFMTVTSMSIFAIIMIGGGFKKNELYSLLFVYQISSIVLGILGLFYSQDMGMGTRRVLMLFGNQIDPNNLVALYAVGTGLSACDLAYKRKHVLISAMGLVANAYCILMSGSRSGIVILAVQVLIVCFLQGEHQNIKTRIYKITGLLILFFVVAYFAFQFIPKAVLDRILGRGNLEFLDGTGRETRWKQAIELWLNEGFLFGCGWGTFEAHNTFFTMLVDVGLVGTLIFLSVLGYIGIKGLLQRNPTAIMVLLTGIIPGFFIGAQNKRFFWNGIIFAAMLVSNSSQIRAYSIERLERKIRD